MLNSDDLYGLQALQQATTHLTSSKNYAIIGYSLKNVLPEQGAVNRGLIKHTNNKLDSLQELFDLTKEIIPSKYTGEELMSMNLFILHPDIFEYLENEFNSFLNKHQNHPTVECLLPDSLGKLVDKGVVIEILPTNSIPLGITHPNDEEYIRKKLIG